MGCPQVNKANTCVVHKWLVPIPPCLVERPLGDSLVEGDRPFLLTGGLGHRQCLGHPHEGAGGAAAAVLGAPGGRAGGRGLGRRLSLLICHASETGCCWQRPSTAGTHRPPGLCRHRPPGHPCQGGGTPRPLGSPPGSMAGTSPSFLLPLQTLRPTWPCCWHRHGPVLVACLPPWWDPSLPGTHLQRATMGRAPARSLTVKCISSQSSPRSLGRRAVSMWRNRGSEC